MKELEKQKINELKEKYFKEFGVIEEIGTKGIDDYDKEEE